MKIFHYIFGPLAKAAYIHSANIFGWPKNILELVGRSGMGLKVANLDSEGT